jgi:hypothetical protein
MNFASVALVLLLPAAVSAIGCGGIHKGLSRHLPVPSFFRAINPKLSEQDRRESFVSRVYA